MQVINNLKKKLTQIRSLLQGHTLRIVVILIIAFIIIPVTVYLVKQQQELRSRAAGGEVGSLAFIPSFPSSSPGSVNTGGSFSIDLGISFTTDQRITGADVTITYTDNLRLDNFVKDTTVLPEQVLDSSNIVANPRTVRYVTVNKTGDLPLRGFVPLGKVTFSVIGSGQAVVTITDRQIVAAGVAGVLNVRETSNTYIIAGSPTLTPSPSAVPIPYTTEYRCSDIKFEKDDVSGGNVPAWKLYQNDDFSGEPIKFKYTFTNNVVSGEDLTIFCQFKTDTTTTSQVYPKSIRYIGGSPKITSASCSYDPSGIGTQVIVKGVNFGEHSDQLDGNVKVAGKDTVLSYWAKDNTNISTDSAQIKDKVISKLQDKLDQGRYPIALTTDEGRLANGYCSIGLTTIDFVVKTQCGVASNMPEVTLEVKEKASNAKTLDKKTVKLSGDGRPTDYAPKLEVGKSYMLLISSLYSLSRKVEFTAEEGTTSLGDVTLLDGDIYGQGSQPDNVINAFDKAQLAREWNIINDVSRPGDLNGDSRVNSVDYACMRQNIGKTGEQ